MDDEGASRWCVDVREPGEHVFAVAVGGEAVEDLDVCLHVAFVAEDADGVVAAEDAAAESAASLIADEEDGALGAADVGDQVVFDAPARTHAGARDDDAGAVDLVNRLRLVDVADEGEAGEIEGGATPSEFVSELWVEDAAVAAEEGGDGGGHGAIDEGDEARDALLLDELLDVEEQLLGAADGEGGDDDVAAAFDRGVDDLGELLLDVGLFVRAVAVGGFDDGVVGVSEWVGVVEERARRAAEVTGEDDG